MARRRHAEATIAISGSVPAIASRISPPSASPSPKPPVERVGRLREAVRRQPRSPPRLRRRSTTRSGVDRLPTRLAYDAVIPRELTTERLLLRQWRDEDVEPLYEIYTQPEYLETMPAHDARGDARAARPLPARAGRRTATASGPPATSRAAADRADRAALPPRLAARRPARSRRSAGCCTATSGAAASRPRAGRPASTPGASTCRTSRGSTRSRPRTTRRSRAVMERLGFTRGGDGALARLRHGLVRR